MLVLSRKKNEKIIVGNGDVVITVVGICGNRVRIGIDAPSDVGVHREEVYVTIRDKETGKLRYTPTEDPKKGASNKPADSVPAGKVKN
jgi:carbon storage regulator